MSSLTEKAGKFFQAAAESITGGDFFGSFKDKPNGGADDKGAKRLPKILLMGLRRSGKSSIQKVVFHKLSPAETLFLESTNMVVKEDISNSSFVQFSVWDFPGQIDFTDTSLTEEALADCGAIVYVIDAQVPIILIA